MKVKNAIFTAIKLALTVLFLILNISVMYISTLQQKGYIETLSNRTEAVHAQKPTDDDFAARITSIFLPFIDRDIPDGKFILMQEKLKGILREHGRNFQKEEKA